jgi:hypothetical protein
MAIAIKANQNVFRVIHPLDDVPEIKCDPDNLGPMHMSTSVRTSLFMLRIYLVVMIALVGYRALELAGAVHVHI